MIYHLILGEGPAPQLTEAEELQRAVQWMALDLQLVSQSHLQAHGSLTVTEAPGGDPLG
jgi:hypothetical protein